MERLVEGLEEDVKECGEDEDGQDRLTERGWLETQRCGVSGRDRGETRRQWCS